MGDAIGQVRRPRRVLSRRRCRAPRSPRTCQRFTTVVTLTRNAKKGLNAVPFSGRIRGKALAPGRYRAVFTPRSGRVAGKAKTVAFRIVTP
jgi:hypothetical protein